MGRKPSRKIVPFVKKATVAKSPDMVPEDANINEYEKIASQIAASSDDIIDRALDRLEGKSAAKKSQKQDCETKKDPVVETEAELVDDYPESEDTAVHAGTISETKVEVQKNDDSATGTPARDPDSLESRIELANSIIGAFERGERIAQPVRDELDKLLTKNDDLILRNSELEFEISRLNAENNRLRQELEARTNSAKLPPQTYSREGYTRVPPGFAQPCRQQRPRMSMNGYESWN